MALWLHGLAKSVKLCSSTSLAVRSLYWERLKGAGRDNRRVSGSSQGCTFHLNKLVVLRWLAHTALCPAGSVLLLCWPAVVKLPLIYGFSLCDPWLYGICAETHRPAKCSAVRVSNPSAVHFPYCLRGKVI